MRDVEGADPAQQGRGGERPALPVQHRAVGDAGRVAGQEHEGFRRVAHRHVPEREGTEQVAGHVVDEDEPERQAAEHVRPEIPAAATCPPPRRGSTPTSRPLRAGGRLSWIASEVASRRTIWRELRCEPGPSPSVLALFTRLGQIGATMRMMFVLLAALLAGAAPLPAAGRGRPRWHPLRRRSRRSARRCRPRLAPSREPRRLRAGQPLTVVAFGSSSTEGVGASTPGHAYPARLEALLRAALPGHEVRVVNRGVGGQDVAEMLGRLDAEVLAERPQLVIWQAGANAALRGMAPEAFRGTLADGVARLRASGTDVVLMDSQLAPVVLARPLYPYLAAAMREVAAAVSVPVFSRADSCAPGKRPASRRSTCSTPTGCTTMTAAMPAWRRRWRSRSSAAWARRRRRPGWRRPRG